MSEATIALIDLLAERFNGLQPLLREHVSDNFGEVLPHVFIGDLTRYVIGLEVEAQQASRDRQPALRRELEEMLAVLEQAYATGDEDQPELIAVSFLENLPYPGEPGDTIRTRLGPQLSEQLKRIGR